MASFSVDLHCDFKDDLCHLHFKRINLNDRSTAMTRFPPAGLVFFLLLVTVGSASASPESDRRTSDLPDIVVYHPPTPDPTYLDEGLPGDSVGDVRIFHFDGETEDGSPVVMEWIMTTTGLNTAQPGAESRVTLGVFSFTGFDQDQILLQGVGLYPSLGDTFLPSSELVRAIVGGTGRFKGATGEVISTHLEDGSWMHVFDFGPRRFGRSRD